MAKISVRNLSLKYPTKQVLKNLSVEIPDRELTVITGLKESGKTSLIRLLCGLDTVLEGEIYVDGVLINKLEPKDRDMAVIIKAVPLNPNASVYDNMAMGMKLRKYPKEEIDSKVNKAAEILGLSEYKKRLVKNLTPGQRLRVLLARAIAREPKIVIIDEVLSGVEAGLRKEICNEIVKLSKRLKINFILVSDSASEALTVADRIIFLEDGTVKQYSTPAEIYDAPNTLAIATFFGAPKINLFQGKLESEGEKVYALTEGWKIEVTQKLSKETAAEYVGTNRNVTFAIRAEDFTLDENGEISAIVDEIKEVSENKVVSYLYSDKVEEGTLFATRFSAEKEKSIRMSVNKDHLLIYDTKNENLLK